MAPVTATHAPKRVLLAAPRGYCAGVDRAVQAVEEALELYGPPVYVRKEIVHNKHVVEELAKRGAIFVDQETEVPEGELVVFSAHGVAPSVHENAAARQLKTIDATCPLVTKVHVSARKFAEQGYSIILIGHEGHEEVEGTTGEAPDAITLVQTVEDAQAVEVSDPERVAFITQTTLSVDETAEIIAVLRQRFPDIVSSKSDDICYATTNRQIAVKQLARECELVLVIGSTNSSNSNRLVEVAREHGAASHLIDNASQVREEWRESRPLASPPEPAPPRSWLRRWSPTSASAAPRPSPSCAPSTRTSASCSRRRSGRSSRLDRVSGLDHLAPLLGEPGAEVLGARLGWPDPDDRAARACVVGGRAHRPRQLDHAGVARVELDNPGARGHVRGHQLAELRVPAGE
jgi:4-hydroxy-3-methylbut-2-enyl diphosphate reductase